MAVAWTICGAGSGVGKTIVSEKLCAALPSAVHVKCGHGRPRKGKTPHFFRDLGGLERFVESHQDAPGHLVIESNAYARRGRGDITVFIDGVNDRTDFRDDAGGLREAADIRICHDSDPGDWARALAPTLTDKPMRDRVCRILAEQKRYLFGPAAAVRTKVWFELGDRHVFGGGLAALLDNIDRCGSLAGAAKAVNISYRRAWALIKTAEDHLGQTLVDRRTGGARGGGSALSAAVMHMLGVFARLDREVGDFARGRFDRLFHAPGGDDG